MAAFWVVVGLDVVEDIGPSCRSGRVTGPMHLLHLQSMEDAFHGGMVITVALFTHTAEEAMLLKDRLVVRPRVRAW